MHAYSSHLNTHTYYQYEHLRKAKTELADLSHYRSTCHLFKEQRG
jgi:hypothetical protein